MPRNFRLIVKGAMNPKHWAMGNIFGYKGSYWIEKMIRKEPSYDQYGSGRNSNLIECEKSRHFYFDSSFSWVNRERIKIE